MIKRKSEESGSEIGVNMNIALGIRTRSKKSEYELERRDMNKK